MRRVLKGLSGSATIPEETTELSFAEPQSLTHKMCPFWLWDSRKRGSHQMLPIYVIFQPCPRSAVIYIASSDGHCCHLLSLIPPHSCQAISQKFHPFLPHSPLYLIQSQVIEKLSSDLSLNFNSASPNCSFHMGVLLSDQMQTGLERNS